MKRALLAIFAACALACQFAAPATAQEWPARSIRIVVAFGPGGGADIVGRIIAQSLQEKLGQPVVVENRPGAAGTLGNEAVARADKDGYTLGVMTAGQIIAAVMNKSLRYDTLIAFDPISLVATAGLIIVARPDFPANDAKDLVTAAKANPGKIAFASPGFGATQHFTGELFKQIANVDMLHVPFRTSPEAISAVLGKQVDLLFDTVSAVLETLRRPWSSRHIAKIQQNRPFPSLLIHRYPATCMPYVCRTEYMGDIYGTDAPRHEARYTRRPAAAQGAARTLLALNLGRVGDRLPERGQGRHLDCAPLQRRARPSLQRDRHSRRHRRC
jgi:hypothetical protein